jgi:1-aminocyclopropane-1-carboxylate deaminase/D-cysteine desulfhydrase-like pyridoxal-dependent ACC family enzyme
MNGRQVMETIAQQVKNVPDNVETIVGIAGSGLSMLGVALGCKLYNKNVKTIYPVALSGYVYKNKKMWYDRLRDRSKFDGDFKVVQSEYPYQHKLKLDESLPLDATYEAKAWDWMVKNLEPSEKVLFWDVGIKEYDLDYIEPIKWHKSEYEKIIDREMRRKHEQVKHNFF